MNEKIFQRFTENARMVNERAVEGKEERKIE